MIDISYGLRTTAAGRQAIALTLDHHGLLPLSAVQDIAITLDGAPVPADGIAVRLSTRTYAPPPMSHPDGPDWVGADELIIEFDAGTASTDPVLLDIVLAADPGPAARQFRDSALLRRRHDPR